MTNRTRKLLATWIFSVFVATNLFAEFGHRLAHHLREIQHTHSLACLWEASARDAHAQRIFPKRSVVLAYDSASEPSAGACELVSILSAWQHSFLEEAHKTLTSRVFGKLVRPSVLRSTQLLTPCVLDRERARAPPSIV